MSHDQQQKYVRSIRESTYLIEQHEAIISLHIREQINKQQTLCQQKTNGNEDLIECQKEIIKQINKLQMTERLKNKFFELKLQRCMSKDGESQTYKCILKLKQMIQKEIKSKE